MWGCNKEVTPKTKEEVLTNNPLTTVIDRRVDSIFRNYAAKVETAGFSLAILEGNEVNTYHYGETRLGNKKLPDDKTLYEIGSVTKTFIAQSLLHWLYIQQIDINTPVKEYLPGQLGDKLSPNNTPVTFRHLLAHLSGLPRIPNDLPNTTDPYQGYDSGKVYSYISKNNLVRMPGTLPTSEQEAYNYYSNLAYGLAGIILERNKKQSLQQILQDDFFGTSERGTDFFGIFPMTSTTLASIEDISNRAFPHNNKNTAGYWHFSGGMAAAGGIKSCLADMIQYAKGQISAANGIGGGTDEAAIIQACQTPVVKINGKDYFGLGWEFYYTNTNKKIIVKDGGTGGFTAFIAFEPKTKKAVVALFNNENTNNMAAPLISLLNVYFN
jgi:CubicO group peptidase (beta-lactamase class C family)